MKRSFAHHYLAILGAFALCFPVQAAFQPGYVVTQAGDTLYGKIDMGTPQSMKFSCWFKSAETNAITHYKPGELKSFSTTDQSRRFVSEKVPYFFKDRVIFLEVLQLGRINLYYTYDVVLNQLYYIKKRNSELIDLMFDWDTHKLIPFKSKYIEFLMKAMADAPELMPEIEKLKTVNPYKLNELTERYNRRFDKSAKTAEANQSPTVAKPHDQVGVSISPGIVIPDLLYMDDRLTDVYSGLSITKGPREKRNGFYLSAGAYIPSFSLTTRYDVLDHSTTRNYFGTSYMVLIPTRLSYRFSQNDLQPLVGIDFNTFLNDKDTWFVLGPSVGLNYTPVRWLSVSCSFQYAMSQIYTRAVRYQTATPLTLFTGISINL